MNWTGYSKRFLALLLCLVMVVGMLPVSALATEPVEEEVVEEVIEEVIDDVVEETPVEEPVTLSETEEPSEEPVVEPVAEESTEVPTEEPTETPTEESTEAPTEAPAEESTEAPTEESTETPTEESAEAPTEESTEAPTEESTEAPTEESTEATEETTEPTEEVVVEEIIAEVEEPVMGEPTVSEDGSSITFPPTYSPVNVYVLVDEPVAGKEYLIVSANSGAAYALNNTPGRTNVTIAEGELTIDGVTDTKKYIEMADASTVLWTAGAVADSTALTYKNGEDYLTYRVSGCNASVAVGAQETAWTYASNKLSAAQGDNTGYLQYGSNSWQINTSGSPKSVYFFEKTTAVMMTAPETTYTLTAEDVQTGAVAGNTVALSHKLMANGAEVTLDGATAVYEVVGGDAIGTIEGSTMTLNGTAGAATVKVTYTYDVYTLVKNFTVTTKAADYAIQITKDGAVVTETIVEKGVTSGKTLTLGADVTYSFEKDGEVFPVENATVIWSVDNGAIATVDQSGVVTFNGGDGQVQVTAQYKVGNEVSVIDTITISVSKTEFIIPSDGTDDFPEYPAEGAIRIDKTATAVGNFSNTGIAQVELSMTGVPYTKGNEIDVVIMIDMSDSMKNNNVGRVKPARESAVAAIEAIVKNEDETINNNRVAVYTFNGYDGTGTQTYANAVEEVLALQSYQNADDKTDTSKLTSAQNSITRWIQNDNTDAGTNYGAALEKCYSVLEAAKVEYPDRKQFVIFVTDGEPTTGFAYETNNGGVKDDGYDSRYQNGAADKYYTYTEYYSKQMRAAGVEVYTVGIQLTNTNANTILKKIGGNSTGTAYDNAGTHSDYAQFIDADESADKLVEIFGNIVNAIKQAATNITVNDVVAEEYSLILELPDEAKDITLPDGTELCMEVVEYELDANKNRKGEGTVIETVSITDTDKVSEVDGKLVIDADNFTYDEATQKLVWKADELNTSELAIRYYVYLNGSADSSIPAGTYPTNEYATIDYTNFQGNQCQKPFPVPQLTWNGAQVSYTFYLVNSEGQPVNRAGKVIPFAEAVYVTDVHTYAITWAQGTGTGELDASYLAKDIVPSVYSLYDTGASYDIYVSQDETVTPYFIIGGDKESSYVFNTKAGTKYNEVGAYSSTGKYIDKDGNEQTATKISNFDFANTTVAFAVVWNPELKEDTIVIDYGMPVEIDVTKNDTMTNEVVGVRADAPAGVAINKGQFSTAQGLKSADVAHGKATVENGATVRYELTDTEISEPVVFYYESAVQYYYGSTLMETNMYSSVTVIPATTIYYEDNFVTLKTYENGEEKDGWPTNSVKADDVQDIDRPGKNELGEGYDFDNVYGYDSSYTECSEHSLGSTASITVNPTTYGTASFSFYGTGFDVISMTSSTTGSIVVDVDGSKSFVDTYYGYNYTLCEVEYRVDNGKWERVKVISESKKAEAGTLPSLEGKVEGETTTIAEMAWIVDNANAEELFQVPVIKVSGLDYGKHTVTITAAYNEVFDNTDAGAYDFYLDAIRIYDPTGNENEVANDAYVADGEGWPVYEEVRNNIIEAAKLNDNKINGAVFIDGKSSVADVADYTNYGPSNEVYLAQGQAIAFNVNKPANVADIQLGIKSADGSEVTYTINGDEKTVKTATDLYYSILEYCDETVTIANTSGGILSLTNIKVTHTSAPTATAELLWIDEVSAEAAVMSLRKAEVEEEIPESSEPEAPEASEEPESSEPEETEPEETKPAAKPNKVIDQVRKTVKKVVGAIGKLFSKWF